MALERTKANILSNIWELYLDDVLMPYSQSSTLNVSNNGQPELVDVEGETPLKFTSRGTTIDFTTVIRQWGGDEFSTFFNLIGESSNVPLVAGDAFPSFEMRWHPRKAADNTSDIVLPEAVFLDIGMPVNNGNNFQLTVRGSAQIPDSGTIIQKGWTAP